jgi:hypothetical protein
MVMVMVILKKGRGGWERLRGMARYECAGVEDDIMWITAVSRQLKKIENGYSLQQRPHPPTSLPFFSNQSLQYI